jgi:beta-phosphoglucomutase
MSSGTRLRAVIFDMDGVLTDSEPLINAAAVSMFRERGLEVQAEDFHPFIGTGENRYLGGVAESYGFALDIPDAKRRTYEIYLELVPAQLHAFPGAVELVEACRQSGLRVAVASSADRIKIDANLRKIGLPPEAWDVIVTGDDVVHKKPAPDLFLAAARTLALTPEECVVVEDAVNGIQAAKAAGMRCVAVAQSFPVERLSLADVVQPRIGDLTVPLLLGEAPGPAETPGDAPATTLPRPAPGRPWGFWATLGFSLVIGSALLGAQTFAGAALALAASAAGREDIVRGIRDGTNGLFLAVGTCVSAPVEVGLVSLFAWLRRGLPLKDYLGLKRVDKRRLLRWCLVVLALCGASDSLTWWLGKPIVPEFLERAYATAGFVPLLGLGLIVAAPLSEELFFRGFLFAGLLHSPLGSWGAVGLTSLAWAATHLQYDLYGMATVFTAGLLLGYARLRTGSIVPGLLMHALINLLATLQAAFGIR